MSKNLTLFFDIIGRTIIGEKTGETDSQLFIKNPVVVNIVNQQMQDPATGQTVSRMALQLLPLFFREFLADKNEGVELVYNKSNITPTKAPVTFEFKLGMQYENLFADVPQQAAPIAPQPPKPEPKNGSNVINLFD